MKRFFSVFVTALLVCLVTTDLWAAPPSTQARYLGFSNVASTSAKASWINGNGAGRIVVISTDNDWNAEDAILTTNAPAYTDNGGNLTGAPEVGSTGSYVIDITTGTARVSNFSNLAANTTYYVKVYEYNNNGSNRDYNNNSAANNPRSFTTLAGLQAPTWAGTPYTINQDANTVSLDWNASLSATGYKISVSTASGVSFDASRLSEYTDLDVGNVTDWEIYLPISGTYYVIVYAYNNSEVSTYSAEQIPIISNSMPPKFLNGDTPTLAEQSSPNYGFFDIILNFDQNVYSANNQTGALATSDFAVYAPSSGSDASAKVTITAVSHSAGSSTATVTVKFTDRVTTTDKFRIGPADDTSVYGEIISPSTTGIPMNTTLHNTKGGQYSADITCPDLSVLNTTDDIAFATIQKAIDANTTIAGETIQLKDNTTYSENTTVYKAVTITDEGGLNNATATGKWTLGGSLDVNLSSKTTTIVGLAFAPNSDASILVSNVYNGTVSIQDNTFTIDNAADIGISVQSNRGTGNLTTLNVGTADGNTFSGVVSGAQAIYFNDDGSGTYGITNVNINKNNFPATTTSIAFENVDLTGYLPQIFLGSSNTNSDGMIITQPYVYSHSDLDASNYLYPGIAVLAANQAALEAGSGVEYNTIAAAIAASTDNGTQTVFLGEGSYSDAIALNEAVSLQGKGANSSTGTVLTNTVTASDNSALHTISNLYFDVQNSNGIVISSNANLTITNNTFNIDANEKGINIPNTQIQSTLTISSNTFSGTGTGVYISTTNGTGASNGTLNITGNTFNNTIGDAIVFEDAVNSSNTLSGAAINIYDGNNFNQSGYGIKILESSTNPSFIGATLPATIDLFNTSINTNLSATDIYGAAWYSLTAGSNNDLLYPSIQQAETADLAATLNIGAGTYAEDVFFSGGSNLSTITGHGATCELATANRVTLEKSYAFTNFSATLVTVGDDDDSAPNTEGNIDDAMDIIKTDGIISIATDAVIGGGTVDKKVTITDAGAGGAIDGTLLVTVSGGDITNLNLAGNPAITINLTNGCSASTVISGNTFTLANGGNGILVETGNVNSTGTSPLNITGNTFSGGDATSKAINFRNQTTGYATFGAVNVYDGNTFNTSGYNFFKTQENNICVYLPSVDVKNTTNNTYTTKNISGFYLDPAATTISTSTETIVTDCTAPAAFTTGNVTTVTNAVSGYWNGNNTAINVEVPIANDVSLTYGTVQIIASRNNWTTTVNLGTANQIDPADINTTKTYTFTDAQFEALSGFTEGDTWKFNAIITDFAGNQTTGTPSSTSIIVDQTAPTVTLNSATLDNIINIAEKAAGFDVNAQSNENNTILYVVNTTDNPSPDYNTIGTVGFVSANSPTANTPVNIAVAANEANIVDAKTYKVFGKDQAGNLSSASSTSFTVDLTAPANFTVGTVDVTNEAKDGYYNKADHDADRTITVQVPVANDATLTNGTIQVQAKIGVGGTYQNVGTPPHTILVGELNTTVTITLSRAQFEGIPGLTQGDEVYFTAVITDLAGNSTTGTASANTLIFDIIPPASPAISSRTAVTAPVVANYFNADNTAVDVVVNIANDATLVGGNVKIQARTNANAFADAGPITNTIASGDINGTKTIQIVKTGTGNTDLDELTGWASGVTLDFQAVITDAAGNPTTGNPFSPSMNVDLVDPLAPVFTLNSGNCINESNQTNVTFTVTGEANATVNWTLTDAGNAHTLTGTVNLGAGGSATVSNQDLSTFNDGVITVSGTQTDLAGNVSPNGNDTENKETDDAGITTLTLTSNNFLNMYAKNGQTLTLAIDADEDVTVTAATIEGNNVISNVTNHADSDASTWDITWTVGSVTDGNTGVFSITLQDACGNTVAFNQTNLTGTNVTYDNTAPTVSSIVRYNPTGEYTNADNPVFRVTFSEPVEITNNNVFTFSGTCTGTPTVQSATGAAGQFGSTALYTTWDVIINGIANENGTLELELDANLANVRDKASNNPAAYTDGESYTIDNTPPAIAVTTPAYDGSRLTSLSQLQGTYSDANGVTAGNVKLSIFRDDNNNGTFDGTDQYWDGSSFSSSTEQKVNANRTGTDFSGNWTYNINLTGYSAETAFKVTVYATDVATNENSASRRFVIDPIPPRVVSLTKTDNNTLVVTFDEALDENWTNVPPGPNGNALATFYTLDGTVNGIPFSGLNPTDATRGGSGNEHKVTLDFSGTPFQGILQCETIHIVVTGVKDIAGNTIDANYDEATYTEPDNTAPYVTSIARYNPSGLLSPYLTNASQVVYRVTFSEPVQNVDVNDFQLTITGSASGTISAVSTVSSSIYDVTVNVDATSDGGTLTVAIAGGNNITDIQCAPGYSDNAFNQGLNSLTPETYTVDRKAPVLTTGFLTHPVTTDYWNDGNHDITWDSTKVSDGYSTDANTTLTFEYSLDGSTNWTAVSPTSTDNAAGSPLTWNVSLPNNTSDNTAKVRVKATDQANNESAWFEGSAFVLDNTPPTATITITPNNATLPNGYSINDSTKTVTIDANFSENMDQSSAPTLSLNLDLDGILNDESPNSAGWQTATQYRWTLAVSNSSLTKLDNTIDVTNAKDLAQNTMTPAQLSNVKVDQVAPTIAFKNAYQSTSFNTNTTDKYAKAGETVFFEFTSSELLPNTYLDSPCGIATFSGEGGTNYSQGYVAPNQVYYIWKGGAELQTTSEGVLTYNVRFVDSAGNCSNQLSGNSGVVFDRTNPVVAITAPTNNSCTNGTQTLTYTLTETNSSSATQAKIASGTLTNFTSGNAINTLDGWSGASEGSQTITVQHTDLAGNVGTATLDVVKDTQAPSISSITLGNVTMGDNASKTTTDNVVSFTVTFNEPVFNFDPNDITLNTTGTINTPDIAVTGTGPYTVTVGSNTNITGDGTLGITVNTSNIVDCGGNALNAPMTSGTFTIDNTAPIVSDVDVNCNNSPINGYTYNQAARVTFSEGVYNSDKASGTITSTEFEIVQTEGNATLQSWSIISATAGGTTVDVSLSMNGTVLGSEKVRADQTTTGTIYDKAGNPMVRVGSAASPNWDYAKVQIIILTQPSSTSACETGTAQFTTSAQGGLSVTYQWQYYDGSDWVNLSNGTLNGATFSGVTTSQLTVTNPNATNWNGKQFRCYVTNDCGSLATNTVTLTVNPNTYISAQPTNATACVGSVNSNFTVTAGGHPPVSYQWQYSSDNNNWNNVVNGTPTNATYTGATTNELNVQGNIAVGTYYYRVIVSSSCGPNVTSDSKTLTVNALPNAGLTVGGTSTICEGSSTNITVASSENGVSYQLRDNSNNPVGNAVTGTGGTISLPTGNLTTTTTFNVLAANATTLCSVQLTETETVTVEATPVNPTLASKTPNQATVCQGSQVSATFTNGSGGNGIDSYEYSTNDGLNWSAYTPSNNITVGTQTVKVRGRRNANVCATNWVELASWNVELTPEAPNLTKDPNSPAVCSGTTVRAIWSSFGNGGNGNYSVEYRTNDGSGFGNWVAYSYNEDGDYYGSDISTTGLTAVEIRFTRKGTECTDSVKTVSWTVNPLPTASISGTTPACQSTILTATTNAASPSYQWKLNGNNISGATNSTYTATTSGNYTVLVTDGSTGCSNTSSQYAVQIDETPTQYNVTGGPFCGGASITIGLSGSQNGYTYRLKHNGNDVVTQTGDGNALTFNVNPSQVGTYTIEAVNGTCTQAMNGSVTVNPAPTANAGSDASTCGTSPYEVSGASATNYASVSWSHNGSGSISNSTTLTPTYTPAAGDIGNTVTLTLTVTALSGCSNVTDQMSLTVSPQATANAGSGASICEASSFTVSTATASNYTSLQWTTNGIGTFSNGTTITPTYIPGVGETGPVTLTLTAYGANGCNATNAMTLTINANPTISTNATNQTRCGTGNVTFTAATTSPNSVIDWSATNNFASYTTGNSYEVSVTAGNTDTYYYRARNTQTGCVSATQSVTGTAYTLPTPTISGDNTVSVNTNLSLTSTNTYSSYSWSADGNPTITNATSQTATFNWSTAGNYDVTLTVTDNNGCQNSTTHPVTVNATQPPTITGNPSNVTKCSNESATFSVTSVSGTPTPTLQWQVSTNNGVDWNAATGGDYSGESTTTLTVNNLGGKNGYEYRLYATNGVNPDAYSNAATLTVTQAETPSVVIASDDVDNTFCSGTSVTFTATPSNTGGGTVSYQWKLNNDNVGSNQNTYTTTSLANNDQVSCVITITAGCVTTTTATSNAITNTVLTVPDQPSAISGNTTVCAGTSGVSYSVANVSGVTYTWSYSGSNVTIASGQGNNSVTLDFAGNATSGTLTVTPSNSCGNGTAQTLAITIPAAISYSTHPANASGNDGGSATFTATVNNATTYKWQVSTDNGSNWSDVPNSSPYSGYNTTTLTINPLSVSMNGYQYKLLSSNACETDIASNSATLNILATEPTTQASAIQFIEIGNSYVKIKWTNGSGSNRIVLCKSGNVSDLTELPVDGTGYTGNMIFGSGSRIDSAYVVANTDKDTASIYGLTYNTTYAFKVIEYNGSGSSANYKTNGFVSGTSNPRQRKIDGKESVNESATIALGEHFILTGITPNPATSDVNFTVVTKESMDANIEVVNELGVVVHSFSKSLTVGEHPFSLKLGTEKGGLPSGTYLLRVTAGGESLIQKFIYMP